MPGGTPWLTDEPVWFEPPTGELYRVHPGVFDAATPNPASRARFALRHGAPSGWEKVGASQPLDTPAGMALIQAALGRHKFEWTPLNTLSPRAINDSAV